MRTLIWTELVGPRGNCGLEVFNSLRRIGSRMPFESLDFDCDSGRNFLNAIVENLLSAWQNCSTIGLDWCP